MGTRVSSDMRSAAPAQATGRLAGRTAARGGAWRLPSPSTGDAPQQRALRRLRNAYRATVSPLQGQPAWVLLVTLFVGAGWLRAAVEKVVDPLWWNGTVLRAFIADHGTLTLPWYRPILDTLVLPNLVLVATIVVLAQLFVGATLLTGRKAPLGLIVGIFLNLNFVAAGAVNPSIFYLVCQAALVLWVMQSGAQEGIAGRTLQWLPVASLALLALNVPFIASLNPATVIDDPAMVLAFFGALLAVSSRLGADQSASGAEADPVRPSLAGFTAPRHAAPVRSSGRSCIALTRVGPEGYACATERW